MYARSDWILYTCINLEDSTVFDAVLYFLITKCHKDDWSHLSSVQEINPFLSTMLNRWGFLKHVLHLFCNSGDKWQRSYFFLPHPNAQRINRPFTYGSDISRLYSEAIWQIHRSSLTTISHWKLMITIATFEHLLKVGTFSNVEDKKRQWVVKTGNY